MFWRCRDNMGFDGQGIRGDVSAELTQLGEIVGVHRQLVDGDIVGGLLGMGPSEHGVGGCVKDVFGVGSGKVGGEGYVERVVDRPVRHLGRGDRRRTLGRYISTSVDRCLHAHVCP